MYKLFENRPVPNEGVVKPLESVYLENRAIAVVNILTDYFTTSAFRPLNQHLLIQLLRNLEMSLETAFEKVVETIYARAPYVANHFNLTSELSYGKPHNSFLYASKENDCVDYIFAKSEVEINPFDPDRSWTELSPMKVLAHPCTDFRCLLPTGELRVPWKGFSVTLIDIPLLALQYREFCLRRVLDHKDNIYNPGKFLTTNVLPKLYKSHLDYAMINQFLVKQGIIEHVEPDQWLPISFPDLSLTAHKAANEIYLKLQRSRRSYLQTLLGIPTIFTENAQEALKLPDTVATRQSNWLKILSRYQIVDFLYKYQGKPGRDMNRSYISDFKRDMGPFLNSKGPSEFRNKTLEASFLESTTRIMNS